MKKNTEIATSILSRVMNLNRRREQFYLHESVEIRDETLKELFRTLALQSASFNQLLLNDVNCPDSKINAHSANIVELNIKSDASGVHADVKSILAASESLEAQAEKIYFDALSSTLPIDMNLRKLISNQHYEIKRAYKKIRELRNTVLTN